MIVPVILSGGSGTRLWPLSRKLYPKQLLALTGEQTLLQQTAARVQGMEDVGRPVVVCNEEHRFLVAEQLRAIGAAPQAIILEPEGRNTAPATAVAALSVPADTVLLVLPADHLVRDVARFQEAVRAGLRHAGAGRLVTFGIDPEGPETGYGYIKRGKAMPGGDAFAVERFVEKPDRATAQGYVASGDYSWNSGMFLFQAGVFLAELERLAPGMLAACRRAVAGASRDLDFTRLDREAFCAAPSDSIDYAVFEKTDRAVVVPMSPGWSDIGSWSALWEVADRDARDNALQGDVLVQDARRCFALADHRLVALVGVEDLAVIETADAVLVAHRDRVQEVKTIVNRLATGGRTEALLHRRVFRPWGHYETMELAGRYQVKRITVKPGAVLSLQMHHHRAEHWIVVKGTARITRGEETFLLSENESTYIPLGMAHRLENPGVIPLELIEVQSGSYLGEDDIVRFSDNYGRAEAGEHGPERT